MCGISARPSPRALCDARASRARQVDETIGRPCAPGRQRPNVARQVAHFAACPDDKPAYTINKACASGCRRSSAGAQAVALGDSDVVLTAGVENMSRIPFLLPGERWGQKLGDMPVLDAMYTDGYLCRLCNQVMGETAETLVDRYQISREDQDAYALESHRRASSADFSGEIVPVSVKGAKGAVVEFGARREPARGHHARGARQAAARVPEGRLGRRGQLVGDHRRGGGA
jgi:acetyl-CoA C-acetyltransferase